MPSASKVSCRPTAKLPIVGELKPAWAPPAKYCPATLLSTLVLCAVSARPLLSTWDFKASLRLPDCGLKKVSRRNTPDQSPVRGSLPDSPMRDWLRLLGATAVMEPLLFFWMIDSVPAGK